MATLRGGDWATQGDVATGNDAHGWRLYRSPPTALAPPPAIAMESRCGSQLGSRSGLRRVARLADGWLASAYNTTPEEFAANTTILARRFRDKGGPGMTFRTLW